VLAGCEDFDYRGSVPTLSDAFSAARQTQPDIILVDHSAGLKAVFELTQAWRDPCIARIIVGLSPSPRPTPARFPLHPALPTSRHRAGFRRRVIGCQDLSYGRQRDQAAHGCQCQPRRTALQTNPNMPTHHKTSDFKCRPGTHKRQHKCVAHLCFTAFTLVWTPSLLLQMTRAFDG